MLELKSPSKVPLGVSRSRAARRAGPSVRCQRVDPLTLMREATEEPRGNHSTKVMSTPCSPIRRVWALSRPDFTPRCSRDSRARSGQRRWAESPRFPGQTGPHCPGRRRLQSGCPTKRERIVPVVTNPEDVDRGHGWRCKLILLSTEVTAARMRSRSIRRGIERSASARAAAAAWTRTCKRAEPAGKYLDAGSDGPNAHRVAAGMISARERSRLAALDDFDAWTFLLGVGADKITAFM
jgi:hypothetical protein